MSSDKYMDVKDPALAAARFIERQRIISDMSGPEMKYQGIIVDWRGDPYVGTVQLAYPEYSDEIVILNKSTKPVTRDLVYEIKMLEPTMKTLPADDQMDLTGRDHILRKFDDRLAKMTREQTLYAMDHPIGLRIELEF